jgi:hypothetical protein
MSRLFSEAVWMSEKIDSLQPQEWRPEYAWLYPIALADGTFEAAPKLVWGAAYAFSRPDWNPAKVAKLLDELERVGLLTRQADESGKVWGRWVGADKHLPTPERAKKLRLKRGRGDLFAAATTQQQDSDVAAPALLRSCYVAATGGGRSGSGLGIGIGEGLGVGSDVDAAKGSGNEPKQPQKPEQVKTNSKSEASFVSGPDLDLKATPAPKPAAMKTIGEYFMADLTISSLTDGELDEKEFAARWLINDDRDNLETCMQEAVAAKASRPYRGLKTNAELMGDTMKLLREVYGKDVPKPWVPMMQLLRDKATLPKASEPFPVPAFITVQTPWHKEHDYELCEDRVWRPPLDREATGYTLKGTDEIWRKP